MRIGVGLSPCFSAKGSAAGPAPAITSANYSQGDTAGGGQPIVLTGTNMTGATNVLIGGNNVAPTSSTATTCTFTLPAHALGVVTATVTTPSGTSGTVSFEYWTPGQITGIDSYLDANKGVTGGAAVSAWLDQSSNAVNYVQATAAQKPAQTASVFGTLPSVRFSGNQWVTSALRTFATGYSIFFVAKTTTSFGASGAVAAPGSVLAGNTGSNWGGFGYDAGATCGAYDRIYNNGGTSAPITIRGSGLNDGTVRLVGVTSNTTPDRKIYVATTQQGATDTPAGGYDTTNTTFDTVGAAFSGLNQLTADVGAVVASVGVMSAGDLTKLDAWSQQRWGT